MEHSETPFYANVSYKGITFAWFYNSNLAVFYVNFLMKRFNMPCNLNLVIGSGANGFDLDGLINYHPWQRFLIRNQCFYISRGKISKSDWDTLSSSLSRSIVEFDYYEKSFDGNL